MMRVATYRKVNWHLIPSSVTSWAWSWPALTWKLVTAGGIPASSWGWGIGSPATHTARRTMQEILMGIEKSGKLGPFGLLGPVHRLDSQVVLCVGMKKVSCFVALSLLVGCEGFGISAPCVGNRLSPQSRGMVDLAPSSRRGSGGGVGMSMASRRDALSSAAPASLAALAAAVATVGPGPALAAENPAEWAIHEGAFSPDTEFADYVTTESGLKYKDVVVGSGETPVKTDTVRAHYVGYTRELNAREWSACDDG
jgi:hypothetical protein